mgnify:CR=1 FL=1
MRWSILLGAVLLAYPVLVYFGLSYFEPRIIALLVVLLAIARFVFASGSRSGTLAPHLLLALAAAVFIGFLTILSNSADFLRYYPVCMNLLMFTLFFVSLLRPPSMIERFARVAEPDLPPSGVRYTRQVTKVWCAFFVFNGGVALYSCLAASMEFWTLYNGAIAYVLMGGLFAGEYAFRIWWRRRDRRY